MHITILVYRFESLKHLKGDHCNRFERKFFVLLKISEVFQGRTELLHYNIIIVLVRTVIVEARKSQLTEFVHILHQRNLTDELALIFRNFFHLNF